MTIPPEQIASYFRIPEDGRFGLEASIDFGGEPPSMGELSSCIDRLRECQRYITAVLWIIQWSEDNISVPEALRPSVTVLADAVFKGNRQSVYLALQHLVASLGLHNPDAGESRFQPRFEFVGAYQQNPIVLRFDVKGHPWALIAAILVFGTVQMMKEYGADACRAQAADIAKHQSASLERIAGRQGRWTPELVDSHKVVLDAANAGAARCGSLLSSFGFHLHVPRGPDFDVRIGEPVPGPRPR